MGRKRIALTIDEDVFVKFQEKIVDYGYSKATVSLLVQKFMVDTVKHIEKHGISPALELFSYEESQSDNSNT